MQIIRQLTKQQILQNNKGLSLIEILVALTLASIIIVASVGNPLRDDRDFINDSLDTLERALRLAADESVLRNSITRVFIDLSKGRAEIKVQYSTGSDFVLPDMASIRDPNQSILEREESEKTLKKLNAEFKDIEELQEEMQYLHENIRFVGVGTSLSEYLTTENPVSVYFYPTGERDGAILMIGSVEEVVSIVVSPFTGKVTREYVTLEEYSDLREEQARIADDLFEKWQRADDD